MRTIVDPRAIDDELARLNRLHGLVSGTLPQNGTDNPPPAPVDVVFYSPYPAQGTLEVDPLAFPAFSSYATPYATYENPVGLRLRPNAVPVALDYQLDDDFADVNLGNCGATPFNVNSVGWDCRYPNTGEEINRFEKAVRDRATALLSSYQPPTYTITNVVIVSHWLDLPYRQKL